MPGVTGNEEGACEISHDQKHPRDGNMPLVQAFHLPEKQNACQKWAINAILSCYIKSHHYWNRQETRNLKTAGMIRLWFIPSSHLKIMQRCERFLILFLLSHLADNYWFEGLVDLHECAYDYLQSPLTILMTKPLNNDLFPLRERQWGKKGMSFFFGAALCIAKTFVQLICINKNSFMD